MTESEKQCSKCLRILPKDSDHFHHKHDTKDGFCSRCKECMNRKFTNFLTHIPKDGHIFCKKCDRELLHTFRYFPVDKNCVSGLRSVCRECNHSYGRFLNEDELPQSGWTEEEKQLLIDNYNNYTGKEMQKYFLQNRSVHAIESYAYLLGIGWKTTEAAAKGREQQKRLTSEKLKGREISQEAREKISKANKEYYATHEHPIKGKKLSPERCAQIKEIALKRQNWVGEKNPRHILPLIGKDNGRWKGGILATYKELRSETKEWSIDSIKFCNRECVITGEKIDNVHHTHPFKDIVEEAFQTLHLEIKPQVKDYSDEEFCMLKQEILRLHNYYGFGACLCKPVHILFHSLYGYTNFTSYDFLEFVYRIDIGEFDNWFKENNLSIKLNCKYIDYLEGTLYQIQSA